MAKESKGGSGAALKMDEATMWKHLCIAKGLDVVLMEDKCRRLELRSMRIEEMVENMTKEMDGKIVALQEIVNYLNSEEARKDVMIKKFEAKVEELTNFIASETERLNKEIETLKAHNELQVNTLDLQLEAANIKLREMHDFALKKQAMEQELIVLKEQLTKEQRDHAEAISDVERSAVQERERLKKEIQTRVEETKIQMTRLMEEQLHQKTKRTIIENEQLRKEVTYHIRQTDMLLQKNEKLTVENTEFHRANVLAKEIEEDLARRNHMYQKTTRILVYKLREMQEAIRKERPDDAQEMTDNEKKEEEELKAILSTTTTPAVPAPKATEQESKTKEEFDSAAPIQPGEEALKFLYACLEDLELERLIDAKASVDAFSPSISPSFSFDTTVLEVGKDLDQLSLVERQTMLKKLLQAAAQFKTLTDEMVGDYLEYSKFGQALPPVAKSNIQIDDIIAMPTDNMHLDDDPARIYQWKKPTTVAVQADMVTDFYLAFPLNPYPPGENILLITHQNSSFGKTRDICDICSFYQELGGAQQSVI